MSDAMRKAIDATLDQLEPDAVATVAYLADRLLMGQRYYGKIDLATDPRDWVKERQDEIGDLLVYTAFGELKKSLKTKSGLTIIPDPKVQQGRIEKVEIRELVTAPVVDRRGTDRASTHGVTFACECVPRELRSDKGLRCANCGVLVRIV